MIEVGKYYTQDDDKNTYGYCIIYPISVKQARNGLIICEGIMLYRNSETGTSVTGGEYIKSSYDELEEYYPDYRESRHF